MPVLSPELARMTFHEGDETGHFANGKIFAQFGDVTDTEWQKVTFQVKILPGQANNDMAPTLRIQGMEPTIWIQEMERISQTLQKIITLNERRRFC
ncbi:hypothetical protein ACFW4D_04960 [Paenibacillus lactis]|uniref:hypothetical protein n=2 Tax=Paenibacillus TaxID=44249 RepID=UPI0011A6AC1E